MSTTKVMEYLIDTIDSTTTERPYTAISSTSTGISYAAATAASSAVHSAELHHNQITFEIPTHRDLEHIDTLHTFNTLLQRIGNSIAYDVQNTAAAAEHPSLVPLDAAGHHPYAITNEQISKSVVLDLADLKSSAATGLERFFAGTDMHAVINYLWIGVVTSLVILSVIFILFSCYFYRKFREWKKCNKDIRSHLNNDIYPDGRVMSCSGESHTDAAYYQMESPPCYTIATGLPTYDEALNHHQQSYSYGMKYVYPALAAVHHHPALGGASDMRQLSNWEKTDSSSVSRQQEKGIKPCYKVTTVSPPAYDMSASVALLSANEKTGAIGICMDVAHEATADTNVQDECCEVVVVTTATTT